MPSRALPAQPHLDHLKREAKALHRAIQAADATALTRAARAIGKSAPLKLSDVQRVIAREYGFPTWARLTQAVRASAGSTAALNSFLQLAQDGDRTGALRVLEEHPYLSTSHLHVAALLGNVETVRRLLAARGGDPNSRAGEPGASPLLFVCFSPFLPDRANELLECARLLLDAGADPNGVDGRFGLPCLYGVTGYRYAPDIARLLLARGANPTDGESLHHSAEQGRVDALDMLLAAGVDVNAVGTWGNTPLYFLVHWYDVEEAAPATGFEWLLERGADPDVRCGKDEETCLHAAARRGRGQRTMEMLLARGAEIRATRRDGMTAWRLAKRAGRDDIAAFLVSRGAATNSLSRGEELLAACGRGDASTAASLTSTLALGELTDADFAMLPDAASRSDESIVAACLAAGFPAGTIDAQGATALHHAAIRGRPAIARMLIDAGAPLMVKDPRHHSPPIGWATFGADFIRDRQGDYEGVTQVLLDAGVRLTSDEHIPQHEGVRKTIEAVQTIPAPQS